MSRKASKRTAIYSSITELFWKSTFGRIVTHLRFASKKMFTGFFESHTLSASVEAVELKFFDDVSDFLFSRNERNFSCRTLKRAIRPRSRFRPLDYAMCAENPVAIRTQNRVDDRFTLTDDALYVVKAFFLVEVEVRSH